MFLKQYSFPLNSNLISLPEGMKNLVGTVLRNDDIGQISLNDSFLNRLVADFYNSHQEHKDRTQITRKLRDGTMLLQMVKQLDSSVSEFKDIFVPSKVDAVMDACQALCNVSPQSNKKVTVGMSLSWLRTEGSKKRIDEIVCSDVLSEEQKLTKKRNVKDFKSCITRQWK